MSAALHPDGKPMRALRVLAAGSSPENPVIEYDAPQGCGPRDARQNASSVASIAGTGATIQPCAKGRAGTPGPSSLRDSTLNAGQDVEGGPAA
jgi:hypothetical protein